MKQPSVDRTAEALRAEVGVKAAELIEFSEDLTRIGGRVPAFRVVGSDVVREFNRTHVRRGLPLDYPAIPQVGSVPPGHLQIAQEFPAFLARTGTALSSPAVIRTSLTWQGSIGRLPGVDTNAFLRAPGDVEQQLPTLYAGLYKAYTSLCMEGCGVDTTTPRVAGLIVMELLEVAAEGVAYLGQDTGVVEIAPVGGEAVVFDSAGSLHASGQLPRRVGKEIVDVLSELSERVPSGELLEVEFIVDGDRGLFWLQRRRLVQRRATGGGTAVYGSVGEFRGPALDLRGTARHATGDRRLLARLAGTGGSAIVVPLKDEACLDAFGLLWLIRNSSLEPPAALVVTHGSGTQAGIRTHLKWTLRHFLPDTLVLPAIDDSVPYALSRIDVHGDGVRTTVRRHAPHRT
ncbi:hypothetical protein ABZ619_24575 [Streptomyces sp. NPDC007851]|uniref:hypothetical protein n=1 Tax=Streptomyces sp. NPDC007851 TaxID=3155008 RepID=UPI0033EAD7D3